MHVQDLELLVYLEGSSTPKEEGCTAWGTLKQLAAGASLVVAEDMPTSPYAQWLQVGPWA